MSLDKIKYMIREKELSEARYDLNLQGLSSPKKRLSYYADGYDVKSNEKNNVQAVTSSTGMPRYCCWS